MGMAIRVIPELSAGPNLIGHDTVLYAGLLTRVTSCINNVSLISQGNSPLLFLVLCPLAKVANPILMMKVTPVVLYGLLGCSVFYFVTKALKFAVLDCILVVAFVMIQTATLRISWDLHPTILATAFLLFLLPNLRSQINAWRAACLLLLAALVIASHELVGALMFLVVALLMVHGSALFRGAAKFLIPIFLAVSAWFILIMSKTTEYEAPFVTYDRNGLLLVSQFLFFTVLFLPLVPLALVGRKWNRILLAWLVVAGTVAFSPLLPLPVAPAFWDRWMLTLTFPLSIMAGIGILRITRALADYAPRLDKRFRPYVTASVLIAIFLPFVIVAQGFMMAAPERPFFLFHDPVLWRAGWSGIPATMQSNTVDFSMSSDIQQVLGWLAARMNSTNVLLTHDAFYGYALLYMPARCNIIWYGYHGLEWGMSRARNYGFKQVYLIWFTPGSGWHSPDPDVSQFKLVYRSGIILLYVTSLVST